MSEPHNPDALGDEFEELGRRAGAELRATAPSDGALSVTRAAARRSAGVVVAGALAVATTIAGGWLLFRGDDTRPVTTVPSIVTTPPSISGLPTPTTELPAPDSTVAAPALNLSIIATRLGGETASQPLLDGSTMPQWKTLEIFEIDGLTKSERPIRTLQASDLGTDTAFDGSGTVSSSGWYVASVNLGHELVFLDLRDATSRPRVVECLCLTRGWNPAGDGYMVIRQRTEIIDPATGRSVAVPNARPFGGAPSLLWSADGTALLSTDSADAGMGTWSMAPIDGSVERVGIAPLFWGGRPRYIDDAGRWIEPGTATVKSDGAAPEVWYDQQLAPARLREVSFTGDGRAAWILLTGATAGTNGLELVRATSPSQRKVVVPLTPFDTLANADAAGLSWATPDDTTIVVSVFHKSTFDDIVLDLGRGTASALPTGVHVSGFVATTLADTLGGHTP